MPCEDVIYIPVQLKTLWFEIDVKKHVQGHKVSISRARILAYQRYLINGDFDPIPSFF